MDKAARELHLKIPKITAGAKIVSKDFTHKRFKRRGISMSPIFQ